MPFDPDKFLRETGGFDPDQYLKDTDTTTQTVEPEVKSYDKPMTGLTIPSEFWGGLTGYGDRLQSDVERHAQTEKQRVEEGASPYWSELTGKMKSMASAVSNLPVIYDAQQLIGKGMPKIAEGIRTTGKAIQTMPGPLQIHGKAIEEGMKRLPGAISKGAELYEEKVPPDIKNVADIGLASAEIVPFVGAGKNIVSKPIAKGLISSTSKLDDIAGKIAEWTSGVDEPALRLAGTKAGRKALKGAYNTQAEVGAQLVDMIDNAYEYMPNYSQIDDALKKIPAVDVTPMAKRLENAIKNPVTKEMQDIALKLQGKADEIRTMASQLGDGGFVNADDLVRYRKELDNIIDDAFGKESGRYLTELKKVRHDIKEAVLKNSKGTDYAPLMEDFAKKLDSVDKMKKLVGKTAETRELRAESFIRNIVNKGKSKSKEWLSDFENTFGGDFVEKAQLAKWAEQMGAEGSGSLLPNWNTGKSLWAQGKGFVVGSPYVASRLTLPATSGLRGFGRKVAMQSITP